MEKEIKVTQCDVCGRKETNSYSSLQIDGWTKYKLFEDWRYGAHSGVHELEIIVCPKCDGRKGIRYFFFRILKPFVTDTQQPQVKTAEGSGS